jgi:FkbM family methyltransferase
VIDRIVAWWRREPELALVRMMCRPDRAFVDVGASRGVYARAALRHAGSVVAIEPLPARAADLRRRLRGRVEVLELALGDDAALLPLHVPSLGARVVDTRASLHADANPGLALAAITVAVRRLDDLGLPPLSGIKLDVEGHELAALRGAERTLARDRPALLVEIEERHRAGATTEVFAWLGARGYRGWFLDGGVLHPIAAFDAARDQAPAEAKQPGSRRRGRYINNFLFRAAG